MLRARYEVIFAYYVRGRFRATRLVLARYVYTTRTLYCSKKVTISPYTRVVITLMSSTLRDTSFYNTYLEVPLNNKIVINSLDNML